MKRANTPTPLRLLAARHAPDELVDDAVKTPIVVERLAVVAGDGDQRAAGVEALMFELPKWFQPPSLTVPARPFGL